MTKTYYTPQPDEFYTYIYWRTDKYPKEPFYVGKGKNGRYYESHSNKHYNNIIGKLERLGLLPEITCAYHGTSEKRAFQAEKLMISLYGRKDLGEGPLVNLTNGGEGACGAVVSEETRAKISSSVSGEKNPHYGKKHSPEARAKISGSRRGKRSPRKGVTLSLETKAKLSAARKGKAAPNRGKQHSPEARAKMSSSMLASWKRKRLEGVAVDERR